MVRPEHRGTRPWVTEPKAPHTHRADAHQPLLARARGTLECHRHPAGVGPRGALHLSGRPHRSGLRHRLHRPARPRGVRAAGPARGRRRHRGAHRRRRGLGGPAPRRRRERLHAFSARTPPAVESWSGPRSTWCSSWRSRTRSRSWPWACSSSCSSSRATSPRARSRDTCPDLVPEQQVGTASGLVGTMSVVGQLVGASIGGLAVALHSVPLGLLCGSRCSRSARCSRQCWAWPTVRSRSRGARAHASRVRGPRSPRRGGTGASCGCSRAGSSSSWPRGPSRGRRGTS